MAWSFPVTGSAGKNKLMVFLVDGTGTASVSGIDKDLVALTDNGVGDYTLTFSPVLAQPPVAVPIARSTGVNVSLQAAPSTSVLRFLVTSSAEKKAVLSLNGIKFHSILQGNDGNDITIAITGSATAGAEVISCTAAGAITIQVQSTVSTAQQVFDALNRPSQGEKQAVLSLNGIKFHSKLQGTAGNALTIQITGGATAGSEVVSSTSAGALTIQVESTVSTATQVYAALKAKTDGTVDAFFGYNLVTGATTWATAAAANLAGGLNDATNDGQMDVHSFVGFELITGATTWATASAANLAGGLSVGDAVDADFDLLVLGSDTY